MFETVLTLFLGCFKKLTKGNRRLISSVRILHATLCCVMSLSKQKTESVECTIMCIESRLSDSWQYQSAGDRAAATDSTLSRTRGRTELRVKIARVSSPAILLLSTSSPYAARSRRDRSDGSSPQHQGHRRQWELLSTPLQSSDSAA